MSVLTAKKCIEVFGMPIYSADYMVMWNLPNSLRIGAIPKKIFCNKLMIQPLSNAFDDLVKSGNVNELISYDGCFNIRNVRGGKAWSLHSWGLAIDLNASSNCLGCKPSLSESFVKCFTDNGFDWGGKFKRLDGMHFQLKSNLVVK